MTKSDFKKSLKAFLVDVEWDAFKESRIDYLLNQLDKETVVETKIKVVEKYINRPVYYGPDRAQIVKPDLDKLAKDFCAEFNTSLEFIRHKSRALEYTDMRVAFINYAFERYPYGVKELGRFLKKDHSTISHYRTRLIGKK